MGVMGLFQHFLQNACFWVRMAPRRGHLCHIDTFQVCLFFMGNDWYKNDLLIAVVTCSFRCGCENYCTLKVSGYTWRILPYFAKRDNAWKQEVIFLVSKTFQKKWGLVGVGGGGILLKGRLCSKREQILSFKSSHQWERRKIFSFSVVPIGGISFTHKQLFALFNGWKREINTHKQNQIFII